MTWEELKEKAKEMGDTSALKTTIILKTNMNSEIEFDDGGNVFVPFSRATLWVSKNRTPEQMLMIMRGLE